MPFPFCVFLSFGLPNDCTDDIGSRKVACENQKLMTDLHHLNTLARRNFFSFSDYANHLHLVFYIITFFAMFVMSRKHVIGYGVCLQNQVTAAARVWTPSFE